MIWFSDHDKGEESKTKSYKKYKHLNNTIYVGAKAEYKRMLTHYHHHTNFFTEGLKFGLIAFLTI